MSRPKQPEDPERFPTPCARCAEHRAIAAIWPDGPVCLNCYPKAKRTRGVCFCGHEGVLPGLIDGNPACRNCSGVRLNVDCVSCGAEDELYSGGRCWSCTLGDIVDATLTNPDTGKIAQDLVPLASALKSMKRANSGLTWIRQGHVKDFFRVLVARESITHEVVDSLPKSPTREFVRGLLVEHEVLPRRDTYLVRFTEWSDAALGRITSSANRDVILRYIRWWHLRRMNQMDEVSNGTFLRAKQTVTVAIELVNWLDERGVPLEELKQKYLDEWISSGPTTRQIASRFLNWARRTRLVSRHLEIAPHRRGGSSRMSAEAQDEAIQRVVHTDELSPRDRAAAILVLVFGQQVRDIVALTWDQVVITDELVTVRMGGFGIELPDPLDVPWRQLAAHPDHEKTAAHPHSNWVFRGRSPGQHITAGFFRHRMKKYFSARAARLGTLHELSKLGHVPVIAEALGYSPTTIERHARDSATNYQRYIANIKTLSEAELDPLLEQPSPPVIG